MTDAALPVVDFVLSNYKNFNARATRDALLAYWRHVSSGGRMFWAVSRAMSSAQLGIILRALLECKRDPEGAEALNASRMG